MRTLTFMTVITPALLTALPAHAMEQGWWVGPAALGAAERQRMALQWGNQADALWGLLVGLGLEALAIGILLFWGRERI